MKRYFVIVFTILFCLFITTSFAAIQVTAIELTANKDIIYPGDTVKLTATILPKNASNKKVSWSSNNNDVATVKGGTIKALGVGTTVITATSANGITATYDIVVSKDTVDMKVHVNSHLIENNHVGNDWYESYKIDKEFYYPQMIISLKQGSTVNINTEITQNDKSPDVGKKKSSHKVTSEDLLGGFTIEQTITVKENKGRYKGSTATWSVVYSFTPVEEEALKQ